MQSPESLRMAVLEALGAHADPRAIELVEQAWIAIVPGVRQWVASSGKVIAHTVRLDVDARALASLRAAPGIHDTLVAAFASAIAREPTDALEELEVYWGFEPAGPERGYREGPMQPVLRHDPAALAHGLITYLEARGEHGAADAMRDAQIDVTRGAHKVAVTVRLAAVDAAYFDHHAHDAGLLEEAVEALARDPSGAKVRTIRRAR